MTLFPGLAVLLFISVSAGVLIWVGFTDAERPEDVKVRMAFVTRQHPDTWENLAEITVDNPGTSPAIVSARCRAVRNPLSRLGPDSATRTALWRAGRLANTAFLGAVPATSQRSWLLPLPRHVSGDVFATVVIDQAKRRSRIISTVLQPAQKTENPLRDV